MSKRKDAVKDKVPKKPLPKYYIAIYAVLLGIFCFSAYKLIDYYYNNYKAEQIVDELTEEKDETNKISDDMLSPQSGSTNAIASPTTSSMPDLAPGNQDTPVIDASGILANYQKLYKENNDMAGWITIDHTNVNYPVMYRKGDNSTYLHTDFEGKGGSRPGSIFIDGRSHLYNKNQSSNLILYGHNMRVGSMFHDIMNYKEESYYLSHPVIYYDTLFEKGTYDIVAVFPFDVSDKDASFIYYKHYHITDQIEFDHYIEGVKKLSIYDTGVTASWGDSLITLSTCADYEADTTNRFVVVAKKRK